MDQYVEAAADYAEIVLIIGCDPDLAEPFTAAIRRVARDLKNAAAEIEEWRGKLFRALHPRRNEPDFADPEKRMGDARQRLAEPGFEVEAPAS